jgi:glycosyltransferase involved in cell wall biosynthesis
MAIISYVSKTVEQGAWTGVGRFDFSLRRVFPDMNSLTVLPSLGPDDIVITDNHLSCEVPPKIRTVVVHHGCARTHFERDPAWRGERLQHVVELQQKMLEMPNRTFVAPSAWVAEQFGNGAKVIPHWVEPIEPLPKYGKPRIIGDWRDNNKGYSTWQKLAAACPDFEFKPLQFRDGAGRRAQYGAASLYLCLSLSEGGSYSVCDAEAAGLPFVTTDTGNYREFDDAEVIRWQDRDDLALVIDAVRRKVESGRRKPSYYASYSFAAWRSLWYEAIGIPC